MAEDLIQPEPSPTDAPLAEPAPAAPAPAEPFTGEIVARPDRSYRLKRYILVAVIFVYGLMSVRDGFFRYPRENAAAQANDITIPHPGFDVPFNQILGCLLPPAALAFLAWSLYASRGELRFDGTTLHVPGHPPVPLSAVQSIDRSRWDRKGIAWVTYERSGAGKPGKFKLDDFVYQRPPTDRIFETVEATLSGPTPTPTETDAVSPASGEDALKHE